jgi:hypothetical protein
VTLRICGLAPPLARPLKGGLKNQTIPQVGMA